MRKVIAAMNMTLDGFCDHTEMIADDELHNHYKDLLSCGGVILYGRITFQLMEYWVPLVENPSDDKSENEFAIAIDRIPKIVFSHTLKQVEWKTATIAKRALAEEVLELKQQAGKDIMVGSPSLIVQLTDLNLIDEYQICVHPVILGSGDTQFFRELTNKVSLKLFRTKTFDSGAVLLYYGLEIK